MKGTPATCMVSVFVLLCACQSARKPAPKPNVAPEPAPVAAEPLPTPSDVAKTLPLVPVSQPEVEALLKTWLDAQNQGEFALYEAAYASRFYGVKRTGQRVARLDRAGWLADRKRMFQHRMQVETSDLTLRSSAGTASVEFVQHWTSGTFEDIGTKRMVLVREQGQLHIALEEMLDSHVYAAKDPAAINTFHFTLKYDSGLYLALPELARPNGRGHARLEGEHEGVYSSSRAIADEASRADLTSWKAQRVQLEDGCVASVAEFRALVRVLPHFGEQARWVQGMNDPPTPPLSAAQIAEEAFEIGRPFVVARLEGCASGEYARLEAAKPVRAAERVVDPALELRARTAFGALSSVTERQRQFLAEVPDAHGLWWEPEIQVDVYRHPDSKRVFVSVYADNGGICGEFGASVWAVFEPRGSRLIKLHEAPASEIKAVLDVHGDGALDFIVGDKYGVDRELVAPHMVGAPGRAPTRLGYDYLDCGC